MKYTSVNEYLKNKYGHKLYKIAVDAGFTCPNRDGSLGMGGCIFCSGRGSGDFAADRLMSVHKQIEEGKKLILNKMPKERNEGPEFIAYFQAFTNTYAPVSVLREKYMEAVNHPDIAIIDIATRPDCLGDDVLGLIKEINEIKPVWVELGLQSIHESTAKYIRRGYELPVYDKAVSDLALIGIEQIITHLILGLPGESKEMMLKSVDYVAASKSNGIKLQLLHVLKGTDLAAEYEKGAFKCLEFEEYVELVKECVSHIPEDMVIHRLTGDGPKKDLIAPLWSGDKKRVINALRKAID